GLADAMVVDVGGTSTDIGQLRRGFPREANSVVEIGGVRTLFRMPDLLSIALGGGSIVERNPLAVGPKSVGYRLTREALVFGGATDEAYRDLPRAEASAWAEGLAREGATAAGADRASLQTVDVEDMPLAYLPGNALRVRVRVAGEMASPEPAQPASSPTTL